jgi:FkbM family methyltransferase
MSFISYAQNFEDVTLWRALKHVEKGFYIDVGANDPESDSVTKAFYEHGWHGINIEPVSEWFDKLEAQRPRDINLQLAVGARKGKATLYEVVGSGLSTMNESIAMQHAKEHGFQQKKYRVPVARLASICNQHPQSDIHFLKIDVEGGEKSALQGFDLKKFRPWIILIESTLPGSQVEKYEDWEPILLAADYEYIKFDGLNRFYVAKEQQGIKARLIAPPNVFDGFVLSGTGSSSFHVGIAQIQASLQKTHQQCQQLEKQKQAAEATLQEVQQQRQQHVKQVESLQAEASQYNKALCEKETQQQELLLSLIEKETRLQEVAATLTDNKQGIGNLQAALEERLVKQQAVETTLQEMQQQRQQCVKQVESLQAEARQHDKRLCEKETQQQELLLSLIEKETRLQEAAAIQIESRQAFDQLQATLADSRAQQQSVETILQEPQQQCQQLEKEIRRLQIEAEQRNELLQERERSIDELNHEGEAAKQQIDELHQSNHQWWSMADQQSKELQEIRVKNEELSGSFHHSSLERERLKSELQAIYHSKFWFLTWPLRKLMQLIKWLLILPIQIILWLIRLPKRFAHWLLVKAKAFVLKHPRVKVRVKKWLEKNPNLYMKLNQQVLRPHAVPCHIEQPQQSDIPLQPDVPSPPDSQRQADPIEFEPSGLEAQIKVAFGRWTIGRRLNV